MKGDQDGSNDDGEAGDEAKINPVAVVGLVAVRELMMCLLAAHGMLDERRKRVKERSRYRSVSLRKTFDILLHRHLTQKCTLDRAPGQMEAERWRATWPLWWLGWAGLTAVWLSV